MPIAKIVADKEITQPAKASFVTADMAAFGVTLFGLALLPLVSFPMFGLAPDVSKKFFLLGIILATFALWLVGRLQEGEIKIPRSLVAIALPFLPLSFLVAGIFSASPHYSLIGPLYQSGTMLFVLALTALAYLVMMLFDTRKRIFNFYLAIMLVRIVAAVYHLAVFLIGVTVYPVIWNYIHQTLDGKWY